MQKPDAHASARHVDAEVARIGKAVRALPVSRRMARRSTRHQFFLGDYDALGQDASLCWLLIAGERVARDCSSRLARSFTVVAVSAASTDAADVVCRVVTVGAFLCLGARLLSSHAGGWTMPMWLQLFGVRHRLPSSSATSARCRTSARGGRVGCGSISRRRAGPLRGELVRREGAGTCR